jgi:hypothetical protein
MRAICECLQADNIVLNERTLAAYVARMRKQLESPPAIKASANDQPREISQGARRKILAPPQAPGQSSDPLENLRERGDKHQVFDYRPELADPKKLI